ncbi:MAG: hypothetical protein IJF96_01075 [Firmicutes bacterium]|nr:hypothetical protein [Bacillota bacterium]
MFGAASIGLVFWIFLLGVFVVGCGMFIVGTVAFGITTAKHEKKRYRIIFAVIAIIGIVMIVIPALQFHYLRQANGADHENCVETDYNTQYRYEWVNGTEHMGFTYNGVDYYSVMPGTISGEEMDTLIPQKRLLEKNAVLNIQEDIGIMDRVFNSYIKQTVYTIKNDFGSELLVTEDCVFSPKDKLLKAQAFYSDLSHYDFYKSTVDDDIGEGSPVDISDEVLKIMDLTISETVNDVKGKDSEVCMVSKDGLFAGYLYFKIIGNKAYIYIDLSGDEDDDEGEGEEEYMRIPDDIARTLIPKLKE